MLLIKDVIKDMKCDINNARKNIDKAMRYKMEHPRLAEKYYKRSVGDLDKCLDLHGEIEVIIAEYRKTKGEPPTEMLIIYNYEHEGLIEDIAEIKQLQDYYKSL